MFISGLCLITFYPHFPVKATMILWSHLVVLWFKRQLLGLLSVQTNVAEFWDVGCFDLLARMASLHSHMQAGPFLTNAFIHKEEI